MDFGDALHDDPPPGGPNGPDGGCGCGGCGGCLPVALVMGVVSFVGSVYVVIRLLLDAV
ncbi:MAG: hypothetical protein Q4D06_04320 [Coriobacteriia bacterium]|nr:hypothetical protein [Coriobacteriia bacterium]